MKQSLLVGIAFLSATVVVKSQSLRVPGSANPWLSGMPAGSTASKCTDSGADIAPAQSPAEVTLVTVQGGKHLRFSVSGSVSHDASDAVPLSPPEGNIAAILQHEAGNENGIANIAAPLDSLIAVFLGSDIPTATPIPDALSFASVESRNYDTLAPALKQPFFIGNARNSSGKPQTIVVPEGATRLFFGTMDGCGWASNRGAFNVTVLDLAPKLSISLQQLDDASPEVEICWSTLPNTIYQLQYLTEPLTQNWINLGEPIPGTGGVNCISDPVLPHEPQRIYRATVEP